MEKMGGTWTQGRGSHRVYRIRDCKTEFAMHGAEIPDGTLRSIEKAMEPCFGKGWLRKGHS